jgi:hypothetical protein
MNEVEVDARGLDKRMAGEIARRAIDVSGGRPVIVKVGLGEPEEAVRKAAALKRRNVIQRASEPGCAVLELAK